MAKNIIIWGLYHESASGAVIKGQEDGLFQIKAWIGDKNICPRCTHNIEDFFQAQFGKKEYYGSGTEFYEDIYRDLFIFMDMFTRRNFPKDDKKIHDYLNAFNLFLDYFANLITTDRIDLVIFGNIPHEGHDFVLYRVAKALKVRTVMCYQSLFSNKFFYMYDLNDYGDFKEVPAQESNEYITVANKFEKELFYMDEVREKTSQKRIPNLLSKAVRSFKSVKKLFSKKWAELPKVFMQAYQIKIRTKEYRQNLKRACCDQVDLHTKYVYFPLHLQPELTTASLGGIYGDQLLALERLSKLIPGDWLIYVKENPKQTEFMRARWFFDRLKLMNNVRLIAPGFDTYLLLKHCVFVATITGTAGWEAISGGKNALIFGKAWYKSLPGVFEYHDRFQLVDILNYQIDHQQLEKELNALLQKTWAGVVDPAYLVMVENFSNDTNNGSLFKFLTKIIKKL